MLTLIVTGIVVYILWKNRYQIQDFFASFTGSEPTTSTDKKTRKPFFNRQEKYLNERINELEEKLLLMRKEQKRNVNTSKIAAPEVTVIKPKDNTANIQQQATQATQSIEGVFQTYFLSGYQRYYCNAPKEKKYFLKSKLSETVNHSRTFYELLIPDDKPDTALFRLINNEEVITKALSNPTAYLVHACDLKGVGNIKEAQTIQYTFGVAEKDETDNWKIIQNAVLKYEMNLGAAYEEYKSKLSEEMATNLPVTTGDLRGKLEDVRDEIDKKLQRNNNEVKKELNQVVSSNSSNYVDKEDLEMLKVELKSFIEDKTTTLDLKDEQPTFSRLVDEAKNNLK